MSERHERSMRLHKESAQRHEAAAALWDSHHEANWAEFERRCAQMEREAAQLDADRASLERLRASGLERPDEAVRAEIDRVTGEIERRRARLSAEHAARAQDRVRLWPQHDGRAARAAQSPVRRDTAAGEPERGEPGAVDDTLGAARRVAAQTRSNAVRLASLLSQTANILERSAALALVHAERLEGAGRTDASAEERRAADRCYEGARRARLHAKAWPELALGRARDGTAEHPTRSAADTLAEHEGMVPPGHLPQESS